MGFALLDDTASRVRRGFERTLRRGRPVTPYQTDTARETRVGLQLMAEATAAAGAMTDEQRMFLATSAPGMRRREAVLLAIPNRSMVEENELQMIRREMAKIEGRDAAPVLVRRAQPWAPQGFLAPLGALAGVRLWMVLAAGWALTGGALAVQSALKERIEDQRDQAREDLAQATAERDAWRERSEQYAQAVTDAREAAQQTAAALDAERRRVARAAARERRRNAEIANVLSGGEPPAWSLRDDESVPQ